MLGNHVARTGRVNDIALFGRCVRGHNSIAKGVIGVGPVSAGVAADQTILHIIGVKWCRRPSVLFVRLPSRS